MRWREARVDWYARLHVCACAREDAQAIAKPSIKPRLRYLDLTCFPALTDKGLAFAVQSCPAIEVIILDGCPGITDVGMHFLATQ